MYIPKPLNTESVVIPQELNQLLEEIAKNVHEVWAKGRMNEGWSYGVARDDRALKTPCLVPYDELAEEEKEYDRKTALETIKVILLLGYSIEKKKH